MTAHLPETNYGNFLFELVRPVREQVQQTDRRDPIQMESFEELELKRAQGREQERLHIARKEDRSVVSNLDLNIDDLLKEKVEEFEEKIGESIVYYSEENKQNPEMENLKEEQLVFIADPIDGTSNMTRNNSQFSTPVAIARVVYGKLDMLAAANISHATDEILWAEKGKGAYRTTYRDITVTPAQLKEQGVKLDTSVSIRDLETERLMLNAPDKSEREADKENIASKFGIKGNIVSLSVYGDKDLANHLFSKIPDAEASRRMTGATALELSHVAMGDSKAAAFVGAPEVNAHDVEAMAFIVKEAGGAVHQLNVDGRQVVVVADHQERALTAANMLKHNIEKHLEEREAKEGKEPEGKQWGPKFRNPRGGDWAHSL